MRRLPEYDWWEAPNPVKRLAHLQMVGAMKKMWQLRDLYPVLAGGCLWHWAESRVARDVDIFLQESDSLQEHIAPPTRTVSDSGEDAVDVDSPSLIGVHRTVLPHPADSTILDLVVTNCSPIEQTGRFDYEHVMVAWTPTWQCLRGGWAYQNGQLIATREEKRRPEETMKAKLEDSWLWGNKDARAYLRHTLLTLSRIYANGAQNGKWEE